MQSLYKYFDGIFVLTTQGSSRIEKVASHLADVGLRNHVSFEVTPNLARTGNNPTQATRLGNLGCAAGHRLIVDKANKAGMEKILVLEDDVEFLPESEAAIDPVFSQLQNTDWEYFNLGGCRFDLQGFATYPFQSEKQGRLRRVKNMSTTHAVAYHKRGFDRIILNLPSHEEVVHGHNNMNMAVAFDLWLSWQPGYYTGDTVFAVQPGDDSVIGNVHIDTPNIIRRTYKDI